MVHVFIVNPTVCEKDLAQKLRQRLSLVPKLNYYVLSTREAGHESELVELLCHFFDNEDVRFYCCGGSGTLRNMLNGFPNMSRAEITCIPYGTCDFLQNFTGDVSAFKNVEDLIDGKVVDVDYIKTNVGVSLNSVSVGMDSELIKSTNSLRGLTIFGKIMPYILASIYASFISPNHAYDITIDNGPTKHEKITEFFIGNGSVVGGNMWFAPKAKINDGKVDLSIIKNCYSFARIGVIRATTQKKLAEKSSVAEIRQAEKIRVRRDGGTYFTVNMDGELFSTHELVAEVVTKGLRFVVPKGVDVDDR